MVGWIRDLGSDDDDDDDDVGGIVGVGTGSGIQCNGSFICTVRRTSKAALIYLGLCIV